MVVQASDRKIKKNYCRVFHTKEIRDLKREHKRDGEVA